MPCLAGSGGWQHRMSRFTQFYTSQKDRLFGYILRRTGNPSLSADMMQESFARYLGTYGRSRPVPSLLYTICRNLIVDHYRKQRPEESLADHHGPSGMDQEEMVILRQQARRVLAAMDQLDPVDRRLLHLATGSNVSYREISKRTNLSEANVKVRIHRARMQLRNILG